MLVRSGQRVHKGQLLARLDSPENRRSSARSRPRPSRCRRASSRLTAEGTGRQRRLHGRRLRRRAGAAPVRANRRYGARSPRCSAAADQARREAAEAAATITSLQGSLALAQKQVAMLEPLAAKHIVPQTDLLDKRREVIDLQGRIAAAREQQGRAHGRGARGAGPGQPGQFRIPPVGARRAQPDQRQDRGQRAIAARRAGQARTGPRSARRSTASSTTSR